MELTFFYISVFIFGLLFGSFSSVLISRWKNKENGILMGRSACPHCKNTLWASELIPLFSFILQGGKCKHCKTRIPWRYPILELSMGLVFVFMSYAGIEIFHVALPSVALFFLIFLGFITIVYIFYDIFFMEIPDEIFIIFIVGNFILFILSYFYNWKFIYFNWNLNHTFHTFYFDKFIGALVLYTFLYAQIFVSGTIYLAKKQKYYDIWELFGYYFLFPLTQKSSEKPRKFGRRRGNSILGGAWWFIFGDYYRLDTWCVTWDCGIFLRVLCRECDWRYCDDACWQAKRTIWSAFWAFSGNRFFLGNFISFTNK